MRADLGALIPPAATRLSSIRASSGAEVVLATTRLGALRAVSRLHPAIGVREQPKHPYATVTAS